VLSTELAAKGLELLRELLPATASVGFLANSKNNATEVEARSVLLRSCKFMDAFVISSLPSRLKETFDGNEEQPT
jgi:hypothetical protein